jgi:hypothetical protein
MYSRLGDTRLPLPPLLLFAGLVATGACLAGGNHLDTLSPRRCPCARSVFFFSTRMPSLRLLWLSVTPNRLLSCRSLGVPVRETAAVTELPTVRLAPCHLNAEMSAWVWVYAHSWCLRARWSKITPNILTRTIWCHMQRASLLPGRHGRSLSRRRLQKHVKWTRSAFSSCYHIVRVNPAR